MNRQGSTRSGRTSAQFPRRKLGARITTAILTLGFLIALPSAVTPAEAATPVYLTVSPAKPMKGEKFVVIGTLTTKVKRPVTLQYKSGSKWKTSTKGTTAATGAFSLTSATKKTKLSVRVSAATVTIGGVRYGQIVTATMTVSTVGQSAKLSVPKSAYVNQAIKANLTISPSRSSRPTQVQYLNSHKKWITLSRGFETSKGASTIPLVAAAKGTFSYRGYLPSWHGAPSKTTSTIKVTIKASKVVPDTDTRTLKKAESDRITSYNSTTGTLVMTSAPTDIVKGKILPVPIMAGARSGALLKVTGITGIGAATKFTTVPASLPEAIKDVPTDGTAVGLTVLSSTFTKTDGVTVASLPQSPRRIGDLKPQDAGMTAQASGPLNLNIDLPVKVGNFTSRLHGTMALTAVPELNIQIVSGQLKSYRIGAGMQVDTHLAQTYGYFGPATLIKHKLGTLRQFFGGLAGPVPVWGEADYNVYFEVEVNGSVNVTFDLSQTGLMSGGIENIPGSYSPRMYSTGAGTSAKLGSLDFEGSVSAFVGPDVDLFLYSAVGPYVQAGAEAAIEMSASPGSGTKCDWAYGPHVEAGIRSSEALEVVTGHKFPEISFTPNLPHTFDGPCPGFTPFELITISLPDAALGAQYSKSLSASGGSTPYTWKATGLPAGIALNSATGTLTGIPPTSGVYNPTFTVTDSAGRSVIRRLPLTVRIKLTAVQVAAGMFYTCALTNAGGVKCWGEDSPGGMEQGIEKFSPRPFDVAGLASGVKAIGAGFSNACALTVSGGVKCWGDNSFGALGDGTTTLRTGPVQVSGLASGVIQISVGQRHSCALLSSGTVKCWGDESATPTLVKGLPAGIVSVTAGVLSDCAITSGGTAMCWGDNTHGELGDGTTLRRTVPVQVKGLAGVTKIAIGGYTEDAGSHACALTTAGAVKCWGWNDDGQLGDGTKTSRRSPVQVVGLTSGVAAISAGGFHSCAATTAGAVKCWGSNGEALGDSSGAPRTTPVQVAGLAAGATGVSSGFGHICSETTAGILKCWGFNDYGQAGDGTTRMRKTPVSVIGFG